MVTLANELWKIRRINEINKRNKCKHGIDSDNECTACLTDSNLLLENKNEPKQFDQEILGEKYYGKTKV